MVRVRFLTDSRNRLSCFFAEGHAGWAESGSDVVCAAISAILQTAWLGLAEVAKVDVAARSDAGSLEVRWPAATRSRADVAAITATAATALEHLARQYPEALEIRHVRESPRRVRAASPRTTSRR